jgi:hypothetical protein
MGYKQYAPTGLDHEIVVSRFQKRFDDQYGKKYFIDVLKNSQDFIPECQRGDWWTPYKYTYEVQVTFDASEKAINLEFFSDWSIEQVEEFMEKFFNIMEPNYYESWDTEERHARPENT